MNVSNFRKEKPIPQCLIGLLGIKREETKKNLTSFACQENNMCIDSNATIMGWHMKMLLEGTLSMTSSIRRLNLCGDHDKVLLVHRS